jgi:hypothetical protein
MAKYTKDLNQLSEEITDLQKKLNQNDSLLADEKTITSNQKDKLIDEKFEKDELEKKITNLKNK